MEIVKTVAYVFGSELLTIRFPTAPDLSIDYLNKAGSMVTGNENTVKLIYAIQDITLMIILNTSGTRSNGHDRTFRGSDPDDDKDKVNTNGNDPNVIEGNGNCMIQGDADTLGHCKTFGDGP